LALQYVRKQTPEVCYRAIKQNGLALQYVDNQTQEICLAAIEQDEKAFKYINKTDNIHLAIVRQNSNTYKNQSRNINDFRALEYIIALMMMMMIIIIIIIMIIIICLFEWFSCIIS
jgi:hypothetical protein